MPAQTLADQEEFAAREHIPYPILPTFEVDGMHLCRRITLVGRGGRIEHVFYPVFPPDRNAADVVAWLRARRGGQSPNGPRRNFGANS
jgi:hypothetical protein